MTVGHPSQQVPAQLPSFLILLCPCSWGYSWSQMKHTLSRSATETDISHYPYVHTQEDGSAVTMCTCVCVCAPRVSPLTCERTAGCWCGGALWAPALLWRLPSSGSGWCPAWSARTCLLEYLSRAAASRFGPAFPDFPRYPRCPPGGAVSLARPLAETVRTEQASKTGLMDQAAAPCRRWACTGWRSATPWRLDHRSHTCRGWGIKTTHVTVHSSKLWLCVGQVLPQQGCQYVPNYVFLWAECGWRNLGWRIQVWGFRFLRIQRL